MALPATCWKPASWRMGLGECLIAPLHAGCAVTAGALVGLDVKETQRYTHVWSCQHSANLPRGDIWCFIVPLHAGCAVTAGALVGLDVEETQRRTRGDPLRLARRRFSPAEVASLKGRSLHGSQHPLWLCTLSTARAPL